jgi:hypothetical protein
VTPRGAAILLAAALLGAATASAQNPPQPAPPSGAPGRAAPPAARAESGAAAVAAPRDTVPPPDSLAPDSFQPQLPRLGPPQGPLPAANRIVFDHDALWFSGAFTLGELLQQVPGVFLVRGGWYGQPEVIQYAGQGASSVEVYWDGFAIDPMGADSGGIDIGTLSLGLLQRVEVERLPTVLRVYLISDVQTLRRPRTETSFATGDASTNTYRLRYLNRWRGGIGLGLGLEDLSTGSANFGSGGSSSVTLWGKGSWIPSSRFGVEYQAMSVAVKRSPFSTAGAGGSLGSNRRRTDLILRGYAATRSDGMGLHFDALAGSSSYTDTASALDRHVLQAAAILGYRAGHWSAEGTARIRDSDTPFEGQLRLDVSPLAPLTVSGALDARSLVGGRRSLDASLAAELRLWPALVLHGALRARRAVATPAALGDTVQRVSDAEGGVSLASRYLDLDATIARHGAYAPPVYGSFGPTVLVYPDSAASTATLTFALKPARFLSLSGWYRRPLGSAPSAYEPPDHSRLSATFRSRLLPILRRGAFDFIAQVAMEAWGQGAIGDSAGTPVVLPGATVIDYRIEMRLVNAALFWTIRNVQNQHYALVGGIRMPSAAQRYGVRWEFTN